MSFDRNKQYSIKSIPNIYGIFDCSIQCGLKGDTIKLLMPVAKESLENRKGSEVLALYDIDLSKEKLFGEEEPILQIFDKQVGEISIAAFGYKKNRIAFASEDVERWSSRG